MDFEVKKCEKMHNCAVKCHDFSKKMGENDFLRDFKIF